MVLSFGHGVVSFGVWDPFWGTPFRVSGSFSLGGRGVLLAVLWLGDGRVQGFVLKGLIRVLGASWPQHQPRRERTVQFTACFGHRQHEIDQHVACENQFSTPGSPNLGGL